MAKQEDGVEREIKLAVADLAEIQEKLRAMGFRLRQPRTLETNILFDREDGSLRAGEMALRLRQYGQRAVLTLKGAPRGDRHKVREEIETAIEDGPALERILARLGYGPVFRYEKYRAEWVDGEGVATVDETPIGNFVELEGGAEWIDRIAGKLGYKEQDYVTMSYVRLYFDHCDRNRMEPSNMVF